MPDSDLRIDFVICWVDGNDPVWRKEKAQYTPDFEEDDSTIRFRDWANLQYWFRGVETFAPWVNKVHFVTWGHIPTWLNKRLSEIAYGESSRLYSRTLSAHI